MDGGRSARRVVLVGLVVAGALAVIGALVDDRSFGVRQLHPPLRAATLAGGTVAELAVAAPVAGPIDAAPTVAIQPVEPPPSLVVGCPWSDDDRAASEADRHHRVVELAYCVLLGRGADPEGSAYWTEQLSSGLRPAELVVQLAASPEYLAGRPGRARPGWSPLVALGAVGPPAGRPPVDPVGPIDGTDGLRVRQALSPAQFQGFVADRQRAETDPVTDAITEAMVHLRIAADGQRINVVYAHLSATRPPRVSPAGRGRSTVGTWADEIGADAAVNGNWYAPWDGPAVAGGQVYGGTDHGYTSLFGFTESGDVVVEHHREINDGVDPRIVEGLSGHPTLVHRGQRTTDFGTDPTFLNRHPRTAIGLDASGDVLILVTVDGRSTRARGMTGDETAQLLERLGAHDAVMLDGGGSSTMWIAGRGVVNDPSGSLRAVGNQIAVFGR